MSANLGENEVWQLQTLQAEDKINDYMTGMENDCYRYVAIVIVEKVLSDGYVLCHTKCRCCCIACVIV